VKFGFSSSHTVVLMCVCACVCVFLFFFLANTTLQLGMVMSIKKKKKTECYVWGSGCMYVCSHGRVKHRATKSAVILSLLGLHAIGTTTFLHLVLVHLLTATLHEIHE
jgi:hypothetical protein